MTSPHPSSSNLPEQTEPGSPPPSGTESQPPGTETARRRRSVRDPFRIGNVQVGAGRKAQTEIPVARLLTGSPLSLPVLALHGVQDGPTVWMNAAIHGDEVNGVEIIRQVLQWIDPRQLSGTVLAVPVVNVPGFMTGDRYLPDRRDLNRSFPGSRRGSLASRIAELFLDEIAGRCDVGIDLHTGSAHRTNLPQVRADLSDDRTAELATAFGAPVILDAPNRDGSLRSEAAERGATVLLYEGGEAWRFDDWAIEVGVRGILAALGQLDMVSTEHIDYPAPGIPVDSVFCSKSRWIRARRAGLARLDVALGDHVERGQVLGRIHDTFGQRLSRISANQPGIVIGLNLDPVVNQGDAMIHLGQRRDVDDDVSDTSDLVEEV